MGSKCFGVKVHFNIKAHTVSGGPLLDESENTASDSG